MTEIRSLCVLSRTYLATDASCEARILKGLAHSLATEGLAVHVLCAAGGGGHEAVFVDDGVVVHPVGLLDCPVPGRPDLDAVLSAIAFREGFARLCATVGVDGVVSGTAAAQSVGLELPPEIPLLVVLMGAPRRGPDPRTEPAGAGAHALGRLALMRADALIAPTAAAAAAAAAALGRPVGVVPPALRPAAHGERRPDGALLSLVAAGPVAPRRRPELAVAALESLQHAGQSARLTFVGEDRPGPAGVSCIESLLLPLIEAGGLADSVEFATGDEIERHRALSRADVVLSPAAGASFDLSMVEALAGGIPVVAASEHGLAPDFGPAEGLIVTGEAPADFVAGVSAALSSRTTLETAGRAAAARAAEVFAPDRAAACLLEAFSKVASPRPRLRRGFAFTAPRLCIVEASGARLPELRRGVSSLLLHTTVPFRLLLIDPGDDPARSAYLGGLDDARCSVVRSAPTPGALRNAGLAAVEDGELAVVFVAPFEVTANWWEPFVSALQASPTAGLAGQGAVRLAAGPAGYVPAALGQEATSAELLLGPCIVARRASLSRIGAFDEGPRAAGATACDLDYAIRARRAGEGLRPVRTDRVLALSPAAQADLTAAVASACGRWHKRLEQLEQTSAPFLVLSRAEELLAEPGLLSTYAAAFTAADEAALVCYGPGEAPDTTLAALSAAAAGAGLDLENGPRVIVLLPETSGEDEVEQLTDEACAFLGHAAPAGPPSRLCRLGPGESEQLRELAARVWRARPRRRDGAVTTLPGAA